MIRIQRPSRGAIDAVLGASDLPFTHREVGATADPARLESLAPRYTLDHHQFPLGTGPALFARARRALLAWRHFEIPWLELHGASAPAHTGQVVATLTHASGLFFLNGCRVVYTEGVEEPAQPVAFAYGTLPGHVVCGEERFAVHLDPATEAVRYEIVAFSRPAILLTRVGYPWVRRIQARFARSSAAALARACAEPSA